MNVLSLDNKNLCLVARPTLGRNPSPFLIGISNSAIFSHSATIISRFLSSCSLHHGWTIALTFKPFLWISILDDCSYTDDLDHRSTLLFSGGLGEQVIRIDLKISLNWLRAPINRAIPHSHEQFFCKLELTIAEDNHHIKL